MTNIPPPPPPIPPDFQSRTYKSCTNTSTSNNNNNHPDKRSNPCIDNKPDEDAFCICVDKPSGLRPIDPRPNIVGPGEAFVSVNGVVIQLRPKEQEGWWQRQRRRRWLSRDEDADGLLLASSSSQLPQPKQERGVVVLAGNEGKEKEEVSGVGGDGGVSKLVKAMAQVGVKVVTEAMSKGGWHWGVSLTRPSVLGVDGDTSDADEDVPGDDIDDGDEPRDGNGDSPEIQHLAGTSLGSLSGVTGVLPVQLTDLPYKGGSVSTSSGRMGRGVH
jgi:hypothetical protein